jgi:protoporphyrinogen oxidase
MPIRDLVQAMSPQPPAPIVSIAEGLVYRDFIIVWLLLDALKLGSVGDAAGTVRDNLIYIHEPDVNAGRLQIFNNWSPWMVSDRSKVWIGIEYFCNQGDSMWSLTDAEMTDLATLEMRRIGLIEVDKPREAHVIRMPKAYPAYRGPMDSSVI